MTVNLNQNRLSWGTGSTDIRVRALALSRTSKLYVVLADDVELAGDLRMIATARVVDQDDNWTQPTSRSTGILEPSGAFAERTGILVARALVDASDGLVPVQLMCLGGPTRLHKDTRLGELLDFQSDDVSINSCTARHTGADL